MPGTSLLQPPPVRWPIEWRWPLPRPGSTDTTFDTNLWFHKGPDDVGPTTASRLMQSETSGTGAHKEVAAFLGVSGWQYWNEGASQNSVNLIHPAYTPILAAPGAGSAGLETPELTRFGWWRVPFAFDIAGAASTWGENCGVGIIGRPRNGPTVGPGDVPPANPGENQIFAGLVGRGGAGSQLLRYAAFDEDGNQIDQVDHPDDFAGRWATVDFLVRQATATQNGRLRVLVNGAELVDAEWNTATLELPDDRVTAAYPNGMGPAIGLALWSGNIALAGNRPGPARWIQTIHFRAGAFNELGVPLLS